MSGFWNLVFVVGAAQGVFLCGLLFLRRTGNETAARLLGGLVGVVALMILATAVVARGPLTYDHLLIFLSTNTELALGPLIYLFARAVVDPDRTLRRADLRHFLPVGLGVLGWGLAWVVLGDAGRRLHFLAGGFVPGYMAFKLLFSLGYLGATYRVLDVERRGTRLHAGGRRPVRLTWMRQSVLVVGALLTAAYATSFADRYEIPLPYGADPFASLAAALLIYLISAMVVQTPWILSLRSRPGGGGRWAEDSRRLTEHLETGRPWLDPELGLADLAGAMGWAENQLSTVLREGLDTGFYALLTDYRLAEFERLARDPATRDRSVLELAYQAGFNSKASFYRAFRASHGTTPTAFRAAL